MKPIRVLIVDDSRTMRMLIASVLQRDPDIDVVGEAADPLEARQAIKALDPDVVTLDVEMPNMNGLDFLEKLMRLRPMPVIMISNRTSHGAETTIRALEIGAFDCVPKPSGDTHEFADLADKVRAAAHARGRIMSRHKPHMPHGPETAPRQSYQSDGRVVAIGSSTGGVEALMTVLSRFPANCPPTVIVQHMPATFTGNFAQRLNRICAASVAEAFDGAPLAAGHIFLARGGVHMEVSGRNTSLRCRLHEKELVNGHRPSVDVLFTSVAKAVGDGALGVILTGMGRDGAEGLLRMRQSGAETLGQDEASSLVYGMPKCAFELGAVDAQLPLRKIGNEILSRTCSSLMEARNVHSR
jgi:two-component system chemotaxis response regulator CheB